MLFLLMQNLQDNWNRDELPMNRGDYGVWEITLPSKDGQPAIPHNTKVKVGLKPYSASPIDADVN